MDTTINVSYRAKGYFSKVWWMAVVEGCVAIAAGLLLLFRPAGTIVFMMQVLAAYFVISGISHVAASIFGSKQQGWWSRLLGGIVLTLIGAAVLSYPLFSASISALVFSMFFASLVVLAGIMMMVWGFSLSAEIPGEGWTVMSGVLSVILGIVLFSSPVVALRGLTLLAGLFAVSGGVGDIFFGLRLRALGEKVNHMNRMGQYAPK
jgi:uncharacterized membrane protein HdeD (DUF308 family)